MNTKYCYYYFTGALSSKFCDEVIKYASQKQEIPAITGTFGTKRDVKKDPLTKKEEKKLHKKRKSDVVWLDDRWIYKEIQPYIHEANFQAGWNFQWDWSEQIQFTKYKVKGYYGWHFENNGSVGSITRHLVFSTYLNDVKDKGETEFYYQKTKIKPKKGKTIIFPATWTHTHRGIPSTKNIKYIVTGWYNY